MSSTLKQIKKQKQKEKVAYEGLLRSVDSQLHIVALMNTLEKMGRFGKFTRAVFEEELAKVKKDFAEKASAQAVPTAQTPVVAQAK